MKNRMIQPMEDKKMGSIVIGIQMPIAAQGRK